MALKICFVSSELSPLAKTGGLADVSAALTKYLHERGHDVRVFVPFYATIAGRFIASPVESVRDVPVHLGAHTYHFSLYAGTIPGTQRLTYFVHCPALFDRSTLYSNAWDEHLRFLLLQRAALESCQRMGFAPDIAHCNDWHVGLLPLMLKTTYAWDRLFATTQSVLTIHNIGYQGVFAASTAAEIGLGEHTSMLHEDDLRRGELNWLKHGIMYADCVTTVSPTYAHEICTPAGGYGLDTVLRARTDNVVGILNGVDYSEWNPQIDARIAHRYGPSTLVGKAKNKASLLHELSLASDERTPLLGIISRMTVQKGFDLLFDTLPEILRSRELSLVALGNGEHRYESFFAQLQERFPDRVHFHRGYDDRLAHMIEAASDMFLMPSLYEPCGLNQMYSLKYGTVPIVRRTGGLADSVQAWDAHTRKGTGIVFDHFDTNAVRWALHTALDLYQDKASWRQMMLNGMAQDFSWEHQGAEYEKLYRELNAP